MPICVRNRITLNGSDENVKKVLDFVRTEGVDDNGKPYVNHFDFNKVIPMPDELNIESGTRGENGMRYLYLKASNPFSLTEDDYNFIERIEKDKTKNPKAFDDMIDLGRKYMMNIAKYGCTDWYQFHNKYWNTKWNSVDTDVNDNVVIFDTAWSYPAPVIEKLSELFPDVTIDFVYADEDCGCNTGCGSIRSGEYSNEEYPDSGSKRGYELYLETHPENADCLVYNPETDVYEWVDE